MYNFRSFLVVVFVVFGTVEASVVRKNTKEFLLPSEDENTSKFGENDVLMSDELWSDNGDRVLVNRGESIGEIDNDSEINQSLLSSRVQDARNGYTGTPKLICYTKKWPLPFVEIPCTGSCYLRHHWSPLGNHISRGCSPHHHDTRTVQRPFVKYCNTNLCNLR